MRSMPRDAATRSTFLVETPQVTIVSARLN